jgi:hypothetical protein
MTPRSRPITIFQAAIVTFGPVGGTARCCQSISPWTKDIATLNGWINAIPSLMEGVGHVAAFEALTEAHSMLEQPSEHTPSPPVQQQLELVMLWLSEALLSTRSSLLTRPHVTNVSRFSGYVRSIPLSFIFIVSL